MESVGNEYPAFLIQDTRWPRENSSETFPGWKTAAFHGWLRTRQAVCPRPAGESARRRCSLPGCRARHVRSRRRPQIDRVRDRIRPVWRRTPV